MAVRDKISTALGSTPRIDAMTVVNAILKANFSSNVVGSAPRIAYDTEKEKEIEIEINLLIQHERERCQNKKEKSVTKTCVMEYLERLSEGPENLTYVGAEDSAND